ncbi:MAG: cell division protein SepF [Clostridia bacterium]|nr:cell division protein SepF [Clostridia bacterium]
MSIKNLFQKILDGYEDTVPTDDFDDEPIYTPKSGSDDELVEVNKGGVRPVRRPAAAAQKAPATAAPAPAAKEAPVEEKKPRFKKVGATRIQSGEQIISLAKEGYVVVVDTSAMAPAVLPKLRYYLAGAMYALDAHISPVDENVFIFSIEEFDVKAFVSSHS